MGVTFITGASSGIGRSLARRMARHDGVAAVARRKEQLDARLAEIEQAGVRALAIACDLIDRDRLLAGGGRAG